MGQICFFKQVFFERVNTKLFGWDQKFFVLSVHLENIYKDLCKVSTAFIISHFSENGLKILVGFWDAHIFSLNFLFPHNKVLMFQKRQVNVFIHCNFVPVNIFYQIAVNIKFLYCMDVSGFSYFSFLRSFPFFL